MSAEFIHDSTGARVLFGTGTASTVPTEAQRLGQRCLLIIDEVANTIAGDLRQALEPLTAGIIDRVRQHVPVEDAESARGVARASGADHIVAIGGGSTIGLAKAVALTEQLPILAVPTTYAGSEMTPIWGLTTAGVKTTGRDPVVAPRTVIYDVLLTMTLPAALTAVSGLNAVAHCVDALWAGGRSPLTDVMAERAIATLAEALPGAVRDGADLTARTGALVGAWLAGATFAVAGSGLHHKLCHILGGRFNLPHAETHAVMLPAVAGVLGNRYPEAGETIRRALKSTDAADGLRELSASVNAPTSLSQLGLSAVQCEALADEIDPTSLGLGVTVTRTDLQLILSGASRGEYAPTLLQAMEAR